MATASLGSFGEELDRARACPTTRRRLKATMPRAAQVELDRLSEAETVEEPRPPRARSRGLIAGLFAAAAAAIHRHFGAFLLVAILALAVAACACVPAEAVQQAETEHAINLGHASDAAITTDARMVGAANAKAWAAQYRALTGRDPRIMERGLGE